MDKVKKYKKMALEARKVALDLIYQAQSSHIGSNFSCIDLLTVIYDIAKIDKHLREDRDRVLPKGWAAAAVYHFLAKKGIIPKSALKQYYKESSKYPGVLEPNTRGVEACGGSLGLGLPFGVGFAFAKKIKKERGYVFVMMTDGEIDVGTTWESALIANHHHLDNLVVIADLNELQAMGKVKDVLDLEPLGKKWQAFGWHVQEIDGHNFKQIIKALSPTSLAKKKPKIILARTVKGKGVSFMEGDNIYHYKAPSEEEYKKALKELESNG